MEGETKQVEVEYSIESCYTFMRTLAFPSESGVLRSNIWFLSFLSLCIEDSLEG